MTEEEAEEDDVMVTKLPLFCHVVSGGWLKKGTMFWLLLHDPTGH